ncbi:gamma-glutamyltransferase [bacterium]|nr:gamma-glutamyltransferase [bacterium]
MKPFFWILILFQVGTIHAQQKSVIASNGVVVSVDDYASNVGVQVLKKGGNAVDAAVATAFALAVTYPIAGNIGGGGFMVIRLANGETIGIDYREMAPAKSTSKMFLNKDGSVDSVKSEVGYLVAGVPGTVRGLELAWKEYGKLPWADLIQPAIDLAENGFAINERFNKDVAEYEAELKLFPETRKTFFKSDGSRYKTGEIFVQKNLAQTLRSISQQGALAFYEGEIAEKLVKDFERHGGILTMNDLKNYHAVKREPLKGAYRGYDIIGMPPPSSGGLTLIEMLNILEYFELKKDNKHYEQSLHIITETMRHAFFDRQRWQGDADFVKVPFDTLMSEEYAAKISKIINREKASSSLEWHRKFVEENEQTTHFSIIDKDGNAVSNTYTIEDAFGSKAIATDLGFLLNNEMHDFNIEPDQPNYAGGYGGNPNVIQPKKRMLSSMCPVIVLKDGKPFLITGSPGGRRIINSVLQVIIGVIDFDLSLREAVDHRRISHNWLPDQLWVEQGMDTAIVKNLQKRGHTIVWKKFIGDTHSILVDPLSGQYYGEADTRRNGAAIGY